MITITGIVTALVLTTAWMPVQSTGVGSGQTPGGGPSEIVELRHAPPAPWSAADPADSLYKEARRALNEENWRKAARLFRTIYSRYPKSEYAPDAYYWEAFALRRMGGERNLKRALNTLAEQRRKFPEAADKGDTQALKTRIEGNLAQIGDAPAGERVVSEARSSTQGCPSRDEDTRLAALQALLNMNSAQAMPILRKVLGRRDACSVQLRRKAVFLVSQKSGADREKVLLNAAANDPDLEVREQAVFWLSQVHSDEAVSALDSILMSAEERSLQEKAIFALSQNGSDRATRILKEYVARPDMPTELRERAIFWLGQRRGSLDYLTGLYEKIDNPDLKEKIIFSVSQQGGNRAGQWLLDLALDRSESIDTRKRALFWAGQSKELDFRKIRGLYSTLTERELREQLIFVASQRREDEAIEFLIDVARNDQDGRLRKKAIFWLGQTNNPKAVEFLMEIIDQ